jgi:hypothetical protein
MAEFALIQANTVARIIDADAAFAASIAPQWQAVVSTQAANAAGQKPGIGWGWTGGPLFVPPVAPAPPPQPAPVYQWFIDPGSFRDRFGAAKLSVLGSTDATIQVLLKDMDGRPWIDLQRADVIQGLAYIGSVVPAVTQQLQSQILTTPPTSFEQLVLRGYFR